MKPEDLNKEIDISTDKVFLPREIVTSRAPHIVTFPELVNMLDRLNKYEEQIQEAKKDLTNRLNSFLEKSV
jgi:hypothetical protein